MKVKLNPGTRIPIQDGYSEYGALVELSDEEGLAVIAAGAGHAVNEPEPPRA